MRTLLKSYGWIAGIILIGGLVPILFYAWALANPVAVNDLRQLDPSGGLNLMSEAIKDGTTPVEGSYRAMNLFDQVSAVIGGYVFKPVHMVLCLLLIWALRRVRSKDLVALRWGLLFFLLGEAFCAVNYLVFDHKSHLSEFLHSYGMVVGFAFTFYALFEGLDKRLFQFTASNKKCAASELCGKCIKSQEVPCGARRIILVILPAMLVLSALPLAARLHAAHYQTGILGTAYTYNWPLLYQLFEARYAPVLALLLFTGAWVAMFLDRRLPVPDAARTLASAGFGALSFGTLRFTLKTIYFENLIWADYWEELTELIFVLAVAVILILFLQRLFQEAFPAGVRISILKILKPDDRPATRV